MGDAPYDSTKAMEEAIRIDLMPVTKLNRRRGRPTGIRRKINWFLETEKEQRVFGLKEIMTNARLLCLLSI